MTGINPKLLAIAERLDAAYQHAGGAALQKDDDAADRARSEIYRLEDELAEVPATNLGELCLKARFAPADTLLIDDALILSIINDLHDLGAQSR